MHTELQNIKGISLNIGIPTNIMLTKSDNPPTLDIDIPEKSGVSYNLKTSQKHGILEVALQSRVSKCHHGHKCNIAITLSSEKLEEIKIDAVMSNIVIGTLKCDHLAVRSVQGVVKIGQETSADRIRLKLIQTESDISMNPDTTQMEIKSINGMTLLKGRNDSEKIRIKSINSHISIDDSTFFGNLNLCDCGVEGGLDCEIINGRFIFENS